MSHLTRLRDAVTYLLGHPSFLALSARPLGPTVRILLDHKFRPVLSLVEDLRVLLKGMSGPDPDVAALGARLMESLAGPDLPNLQTPEDLAEVLAFARRAQTLLHAMRLETARVRVGGLLHSSVTCSGDVEVGAKGAYQSEIVSHGRVTVAGRVSGGSAYAHRAVAAEELGTPMGSLTTVRTGPEGRIDTGVIHPGTMVRIGPLGRRLDTRLVDCRVRIGPDDNLLVQGMEPIGKAPEAPAVSPAPGRTRSARPAPGPG